VKLRALAPIEWPTLPPTDKRPLTRAESRRRQSEPPTYLRRLLARVEYGGLDTAWGDAAMAYWALLDRVLEDRVVENSEGEALLDLAARWGLGGEQIRLIHGNYLKQVANAAVADGIVTEQELRDLKVVHRLLLGGGGPGIDEVLQEAAAGMVAAPYVPPAVDDSTTDLIGKRVCFTGTMQCTRKEAEELATLAGLEVVNAVTKNLDLLVVADPHTQSGKAKKARRYGTRIMFEAVFWKALRVEPSAQAH
jgi:DNA polymerase III subunit epsilon